MSIDTSSLKRFAQNTRTQLIAEVTNRLSQITQADGMEQREKAKSIEQLNNEIQKIGQAAVIEKVAYTWVNRLVAFRFMDVNGYTDSGIVSGPDGTPQILKDAQAGIIDDDLKVDRDRIKDILLGNIPSDNAQNEVYKLLLVAECHRWYKVMPFIFQPIDDYTELLLPQDMLTSQSIRAAVESGMTTEECSEVEIIGWLYQFYISELNEKLIKSKNAYKKNELAPASQLFTPNWIVRYMVDNTLGQVWSEINPETKVTYTLDYYIKPSYLDQLEKREKKSIEEIKFFEPCVGSGHILVYAFDVFYKIYEEQGFTQPAEIAKSIITKNLWGADIDERAAQLASFVLIMKGREKHRRFLKLVEKEQIKPNITFYQNFDSDPKFNNATALGSLIEILPQEIAAQNENDKSLFSERKKDLGLLYKLLGQRYDVVVTNPPYINSSRMEGSLKQYVAKNYPETKSDLFATFILRCLALCNEDGLTGFMTPFVWMFISSYEKLRDKIIKDHFINNLIQLEYSGFDGATVPICTFTFRNKLIESSKGSYIRLSDFKGANNQAPKTLEAIQNPDCGWFFNADQKDFEKIPGSPLAFWISSSELDIYISKRLLGEFCHPAKGIDTGENAFFLRFWFEIHPNEFKTQQPLKKWVPYNKGGEFRRWYGNREYVLRWSGGTHLQERKTWKKKKPTLRNKDKWFKEGFTWTTVSSGGFSARYCEEGALFDNGGCTLFSNDNLMLYGAFINSKVASRYFEFLSPTLNFQPGGTGTLPLHKDLLNGSINEKFVTENISLSKLDWNRSETAWEFIANDLVRANEYNLKASMKLFCSNWNSKFLKLHKNEEQLNSQFINIYGLDGQLTPNIHLGDITILQNELVSRKLKKKKGEDANLGKWNSIWAELDKQLRKDGYNGLNLPFNLVEILLQYVSYAVGCMMGRYSLDKEGLILGYQGERFQDYFKKVDKPDKEVSFLPDDDAIIPILDDAWFEDDIVGRFHAFLKASFSPESFDENLRYLEEQLGKDVRKWFVKEFYKDHVKRYKKRPIYWMFSSPKGYFNALIYMHRYTPDMVSTILHDYLKPYVSKLEAHIGHIDNQMTTTGLSSSEKNKLEKQKKKTREAILDCMDYERDVLLDIAQRRIEIDLDDGVLVNYNKFGKAVKNVAGLNDANAKKTIRGFDWIDTSLILD